MKNKLFISLLPLETERLIIRKTTLEDVDMILKMDKQEPTQRFLGGIKNKNKEERLLFLKKKTNKFKDGLAGSLTVCLKDTTPIGISGLTIDEDNNCAKLGYIFDYDYCNKGYCTETCKKLLDIAFNKLKLNKVYADTIDGNISSIKVLEKLHFKLEGTRRESAHMNNNEYRDFLDYGILAKEYYKEGEL